MSEDYDALRQKLIDYRVRMGMDHQQLAKALKVSTAWIQMAEEMHGFTTHPHIVARVAKYYGLTRAEQMMLVPEQRRTWLRDAVDEAGRDLRKPPVRVPGEFKHCLCLNYEVLKSKLECQTAQMVDGLAIELGLTGSQLRRILRRGYAEDRMCKHLACLLGCDESEQIAFHDGAELLRRIKVTSSQDREIKRDTNQREIDVPLIVRGLREKDMSVAEAERRLNVNRNMLNAALKRGATSLPFIARIAELIGVEAKYLIKDRARNEDRSV